MVFDRPKLLQDNDAAAQIEFSPVAEKYFLYRVDTVKLQKTFWLMRTEDVELLLKGVDAVGRDAAEFEEGIASWYYERLAIIYRKQKRHGDEVAILERYAAHKAAGRGPDRMAARLHKSLAKIDSNKT